MKFRSDVKIGRTFTWGELAGGELKKIARWAAQHDSKDIRFTLLIPEAILSTEDLMSEEEVEVTYETWGNLVGPRTSMKEYLASTDETAPGTNSAAATIKEALDKLPPEVRERALALTLADLIAGTDVPGGVSAKPTSTEDLGAREGVQRDADVDSADGCDEALEVTGAADRAGVSPMFRRAKNSVLLRVAGAENLLDCPNCKVCGTIRLVDGDLQCKACGYSWGDVDDLPEWI